MFIERSLVRYFGNVLRGIPLFEMRLRQMGISVDLKLTNRDGFIDQITFQLISYESSLLCLTSIIQELKKKTAKCVWGFHTLGRRYQNL